MRTHPGLVSSCRVPKYAPIHHQDKCGFFWTVVKLSPPTRQSPRKWYHYWVSARLPAEVSAAGGEEPLLSSSRKSRDQRENSSLMDSVMKEPGQGLLMEMSICRFMQHILTQGTAGERRVSYLIKGSSEEETGSLELSPVLPRYRRGSSFQLSPNFLRLSLFWHHKSVMGAFLLINISSPSTGKLMWYMGHSYAQKMKMTWSVKTPGPL